MNWPLIILVFGWCLALLFFLSGMEAGVFELSRLRIRQLMRAGQPRARALYGYLEKPEIFLWTILVGNTLANFVGVSLLVFVLHQWLRAHPWLFLLCFVLVVFFFYASCDLLPKMLFRLYPNRLCLMLALPFRFVHVGLAPLVAVVSWLADGLLRWTGGKLFTGHLFANRDELRLVMQESAQGLSSEERVMINRVLDLQNLRLRQVIVPLERITAVPSQTLMAEVLKICAEKKLTRLPVWQVDVSTQRIAGIVSLNTLLYLPHLDLSKTAGDYVKPALYLDEDLRLEEALKQMQKSGQRLAIVLGRDRRELGLITLQDILRAIFGEVSL